MALFDDLDTRTAAAVGRIFEDIVIWHPMIAGGGGFIVTARPDLNRPVRELDAIISWAPIGLPVEGSPGGGIVATATLMIDFQLFHFHEEPFAEYGAPRTGDWLEMPTEKVVANRMVEITRVGDDGSARFWAWCRIVNPADMGPRAAPAQTNVSGHLAAGGFVIEDE